MSDYVSMKVIEKFCMRAQPGSTGNSLAINLTSTLVDAIEKDIIATDFTPDEIKDLYPRITCPPGEGFSSIPPFSNSIWQSVTEFGLFDRMNHDSGRWSTSMDTDRNLSGNLFSDRMENLAVDLHTMLSPAGREREEDWSSLMARNGIENTWKRVKNSSPRYYLCIDGDDDDCICEVVGGNKKFYCV